jgi:general L-amino acid transport system permease protein
MAAAARAFVLTAPAPVEAPPPDTGNRFMRLAVSLFATPFNFALTVLSVGLILLVLPPFLNFMIFDATWHGTSRADCLPNAGACWPFIKAKFGQYVYGFYPIDERWRPNVAFALGAVLLAPLLIPSAPFKWLNSILFFGVYPVIAFVLLTGGNLDLRSFLLGRFISLQSIIGLGVSGGLRSTFWADFLLSSALLTAFVVFVTSVISASKRTAAGVCLTIVVLLGAVLLAADLDFGLRSVETRAWGGFLVTMVVAVTGIVVSLPLGILLALGRRSELPVVRFFSIVFIEFWRGVPVITVLFFATYMLPLFLPSGVSFDTLLRALVGVALFSAAYMAEVVRGGLQAIPRGQYEAAAALGLGYWRTMSTVILPQALSLVVPGIVNNFIGLFKDTTLVLIVAIFDLLGQLRASFSDPNWATPVTLYTGFAFAGVVYFVCCFAMSRYALFVERRVNVAGRR